MPTEKFVFQGHDGHQLAGRLDKPDGPHLATALFAHCFTCSKDIFAARRIAGRLAALGIAVLRFDFTGLGHSDGEFENTHFTSNVKDLHAAVEALSERGMAPSLMIGHSLGGAAVLAAAGAHDGIKAVATIGAPFDPHHVTHNFGDKLDEILDKGVAEVSLSGRPFTIRKAFVEDVAAAELGPKISALGKALMVLHSPLDAVVSVDNAAEIFTAARHPKSFVTLDDADHLLSDGDDAEYAASVISAWVQRYIPLDEPAPASAPEGVTRVSEADANGFLQDVTVGDKHHVLADEPVSFGGSDRGMSPYGFLSAALGACTSMTVRMYARRKGWPLSHVSVDVTHEKIHGEDAEGASAKIDRFRRVVRLVGDLTEEQRQRLMEIANKCPVHRTLVAKAEIVTALASAEAAAA